MLPACAAEAGERVPRDVMASRDGNLADCGGHVVHGNLEKSLGDFLEALVPDSVGDLLQPRPRRIGVERLIALRSEHVRKLPRVDTTEEKIAVGDGEWSAIAVTGGTRVRARALRPNAEAHAVEAANRPAARRDGVNLHHRRADAHARDNAFV